MVTTEEHPFRVWLDTELRSRRISMRQLAAQTGVHHSTISRLRRGRPPTLDTAIRLGYVNTGGSGRMIVKFRLKPLYLVVTGTPHVPVQVFVGEKVGALQLAGEVTLREEDRRC